MDPQRRKSLDALIAVASTRGWDYIDTVLHGWELSDREVITLLTWMLCREDTPTKAVLCQLVSRARLDAKS